MTLRETAGYATRLSLEVLDPRPIWRNAREVFHYMRDARRYQRLTGRRIAHRDRVPRLHDRVGSHPYDAHYLQQDAWALRRVAERRPRVHVDVSSRIDFVAACGALTPTLAVEFRPLRVQLDDIHPVGADIQRLPFRDASLPSVSCLHVVEHIGLGRYGDPLDPEGSRRAIRELCRVVAPGGQLLLSLIVGREREAFNCHRVHAPATIDEILRKAGLEIREFSGVDDAGRFQRHRSPDEFAHSRFALGLYVAERVA